MEVNPLRDLVREHLDGPPFERGHERFVTSRYGEASRHQMNIADTGVTRTIASFQQADGVASESKRPGRAKSPSICGHADQSH